MRRLILALALLPSLALGQGGGGTDALPDPARYDAWLTTCLPGHGHGPIRAVSRLPDGETVQGTFSGGGRVLFTALTGDDCSQVFPIGRASARARGAFDAGGRVLEAFTMIRTDGQCPGEDEGGCSQVLVFEDRGGTYRAAAHLDACHNPTLQPVKLFSKTVDAIAVDCAFSNGGDRWSHTAHLFALGSVGLKRVLTVKLGYASSAMGLPEVSARSGGAARCEIAAPGSFEVVHVGAKPLVVVREADFGDPKARLAHSRREWDGAQFAVVGAPTEVDPPRAVICHDGVP